MSTCPNMEPVDLCDVVVPKEFCKKSDLAQLAEIVEAMRDSICNGETEIPTHQFICNITANMPAIIPGVPPSAPSDPVTGSSVMVDYFNGYIRWVYDGSAWGYCARDFTTGPVISPNK